MKMAKKRGKETIVPSGPNEPQDVTWMIPIVEEKFDIFY